MNTSEYQQGFQDLYSEIYRDYYQFEENVLLHSRNFMMRNLNAFGLNQAKLLRAEGGLRILNIGTGRETVNFHKLGAGKIFHFDLSELAVAAISNYIQKNNIKNIITERKDICTSEGLSLTEPIDFVYMHGIINHLRDANQAYTNILTNLNEGGRIFISNYRSGSFVFFVVDFVRKIVSLSEMEKTRSVFKKIFPDLYIAPLQLTNTSGDHNEQFHSLFSCAWDDFLPLLYHCIIQDNFIPSSQKQGFCHFRIRIVFSATITMIRTIVFFKIHCTTLYVIRSGCLR
ncbi:class I SAM-dependent methyltransferase [Leptospira borgpetersenii]|uniref:class I SAM-dependent methyltransferase n=1 Tax=Leptospira borgpetersenii TaxID=174 RepID=UPI000773AFDA|nr:methyltransferase domain-containing protein [Leptospira borgpetersenii]